MSESTNRDPFRDDTLPVDAVRDIDRLSGLKNLYGMAINRYKKFVTNNMDWLHAGNGAYDYEEFLLEVNSTVFARSLGVRALGNLEVRFIHTPGLLLPDAKLLEGQTTIKIYDADADTALRRAPMRRTAEDDPTFDLIEGPQTYEHFQQAQQSLLHMGGAQKLMIDEVQNFINQAR